jgi:hypothetical protein
MNLMDKKYLPYLDGYYMVSQDGYIYVTQGKNGSIAGRFMLPMYSGRCAQYNLRVQGRARKMTAGAILEEVWSIIKTLNAADVELIRQNVEAHHAEHIPELSAVFMDRARRAKATNKAMKEAAAQGPQGGMPCPWQMGYLTTLPPGVTSWDDPIMDPLGAGTAKVMLVMGAKQESRRAA